ncbi:MAG: class I SAM-dependent methyltransferase [Phycisphaerales bacterium]|nr:MAG: class I SAM-dependent methyltransferase [Phycisphaerales bacterium]
MPLVDYHDQFARAYDTFYADQDVAEEVRQATGLLEINGKLGRRPRVLDFGCGTGSHVIAFAEQGIDAVGFDTSPAMIAQARAKPLPPGPAKVRFEAGVFTSWCGQDPNEHFDGTVSFANILNCMESPEAMLAHLHSIRQKLAIGAKAFIEVWNGAAVFVDDPRPEIIRSQDRNNPAREVIRITRPEVDRINQRCILHYHVLTVDRSTGSSEEFDSTHRLQFLTPVQYRHLFELAGLAVVSEFPKDHPHASITERDWHIAYLLCRQE